MRINERIEKLSEIIGRSVNIYRQIKKIYKKKGANGYLQSLSLLRLPLH